MKLGRPPVPLSKMLLSSALRCSPTSLHGSVCGCRAEKGKWAVHSGKFCVCRRACRRSAPQQGCAAQQHGAAWPTAAAWLTSGIPAAHHPPDDAWLPAAACNRGGRKSAIGNSTSRQPAAGSRCAACRLRPHLAAGCIQGSKNFLLPVPRHLHAAPRPAAAPSG